MWLKTGGADSLPVRYIFQNEFIGVGVKPLLNLFGFRILIKWSCIEVEFVECAYLVTFGQNSFAHFLIFTDLDIRYFYLADRVLWVEITVPAVIFAYPESAELQALVVLMKTLYLIVNHISKSREQFYAGIVVQLSSHVVSKLLLAPSFDGLIN